MVENSQKKSKKIDLAPNKEIYRSAAVDVNPIDAIEELVDNAIDNWARISQRVDNATIDITANGTLTRVRDDTGGLDADDIRLLFALGETFQQEVAGSIGSYGIGAKKALVRLGEERVVKSRARGAETGYGFRVDEEWLDSSDWEVAEEEFTDIEEGVTELETHADEPLWDDERIARLKETLRYTYARFLERSAVKGKLTIRVNGEELDPPADIPWSFVPFDGLAPRQFKSIELYPKSLDDPVTMDVTVGLMRNASAEHSGTDIYIQDRLVTKSEKGEVGGYGSVADDRIGNFTSHNHRLRVVVKLGTDGDSSDLPWDGQKTTIDPYHPVSRAAFDWLRRIVRPYFQADSNKVPSAFVEPYTSDHKHAANSGEIEELDYSDRSNVNDKPDKKLPTVKEVRKVAESDAKRGLLITDRFGPVKQAAYEAHVRSQASDVEALRELTSEELGQEDAGPDDEDETELTELFDGISGMGAAKQEALRDAGYDSADAIRDASVEDLTAVEGVGRALAERLLGKARDGEVGDPGPDDDEDGQVSVPLNMSDDEFEDLRERLGVDEDATPEEVGEKLAPRILTMFAPAQ